MGLTIYCVMFIIMTTSVRGYTVCGDPSYKAKEAVEATDKIVASLMQRRTAQWLWNSVSTITALQVAAPTKMFGRMKTRKSLEDTVRFYWDYLDLIDKGEIAFAARSLCLDPEKIGGFNLLDSIHDNISLNIESEEFAITHHVIDFAIMLGSLCLNDYPMDKRLVENLLLLQNHDGSFGPDEHAADATISMLRPMYCLSRMTNPQFDVQNVTTAVKKMRKFIMTQVNELDDESGGVYIGQDEVTSSNALVALYKTMDTGENPNELWKCREVMDTLGMAISDQDDEYHLQEDLLRITATDYLDMQGPNYACVTVTDPIPKGYKPICDYEKPVTCGMGSPDEPK